jgi:plastocyanin
MRHLSRPFVWLAGSAGTTRAAFVAVVFVLVALPALMPVIATPRTAPREFVLVVHDMAFYRDGSTEPNPTIVVKASEEIRVKVKNQDTGITHALSVGATRASIDRIVPGATETMKFRAPDKPGRYEYVCPPHAQMMKGVLLVTQ